jgi:hypothetical protein
MSIRIGYLLPTRERVMAGQPQAASLLELLSELSAWASISENFSSARRTPRLLCGRLRVRQIDRTGCRRLGYILVILLLSRARSFLDNQRSVA